jgi:ATP-binding protein involved in chromosome partitioning
MRAMSAPSEAAIREAMRGVIDPELRRDVVELGMLGPIVITGGEVLVEIILTVPGCPLKQNLEGQVRHHASTVAGVERVEVRFSHMDEAQRAELKTRLTGGERPPTKGLSVDPGTRVIAVASGKGGVGKSSLSVNLALALRNLGREVGIVDADIYGWSVPGMLGIQQRPISLDGMIIPPVAHDIRVMSIGFFLEQEGAIIWRGPMLHRALEQFLSDVHWGALDYLVVDMPPGTGDVGLSLGQLMPRAEAVVVTTPQLAAQRVAERAAAMVKKVGQELVGIVENMSAYPCPCCGELTAPFGQGGGARLADQLGVPLLGEVPLEAALREGADEGVPLLLSAPGSPAALAIAGVAERLDAMRPRGPVRVASPLAMIRS